MLAIAAFMGGSSISDVSSYFKDAFYRYDVATTRGGQELRRYATKSQLLLADFCCEQGMFGEANAALMRAQSQVR